MVSSTAIAANLSPLSFTQVPQRTYVEAVLGLYELTRTELLKDVFIWAYECSAARYATIRQTIGEPDPFRVRYRDMLCELVTDLVRSRVSRQDATRRIAVWTLQQIVPADRARFVELAEDQLMSLHQGNFARFRLRPSEFAAWRQVWEAKAG
jgi:hypothetical protein